MPTAPRIAVELETTAGARYLLQPDEYDNTADARLTIRQDAQSGAAYSFGQSLLLFGRARALVFSEIIDAPAPALASLKIRLFDTCCRDAAGNPALLFDGIIEAGDVRWCEKDVSTTECFVEVSFRDNGAEADAITCLKNIVIWSREYNGRTSRGEDEGRPARNLVYYEESRPRVFTSIVLGLAVLVAYVVLVAIAALSLGIAAGIAANAARQIIDSIIRKRFHRIPFVTSYLANICTLCGLRLSSSLFAQGGFLYNLVRLDAAIQEGGRDQTEAARIFREYNAPNITAIQFLDSFRPLNITYKVSGNTLYIEPKNFFGQTLWIDFVTREADVLKLCFEQSDTAQPAGRIYQYTNDQSDKAGNEVLRLWSGYVVDYNTPPNPNLRGIDTVTLPYGTARFLNDTLDSPLANAADGGGFAGSLIGGLGALNDRAMIIQTGVIGLPKLLEIDPQSDPAECLVKDFNAKMWLYSNPAANNPLAGQLNVSTTESIYDRLLTIDDPRLNMQKNQRFELTFSYNCDDLRNFAFEKPIQLLRGGAPVLGKVENVEIDLRLGQATISGTI